MGSVCSCLLSCQLLALLDLSALLLTAEHLVRVFVQENDIHQVLSYGLSSYVSCSCTLDRSIQLMPHVDVGTALGLLGSWYDWDQC